MKILFHLGHPAHFHLFKNIISDFTNKGDNVLILIKKKDVLEKLLDESGFKYFNILPKGRKDNKISIAPGHIQTGYCCSKRTGLKIRGILFYFTTCCIKGTS